MTHFDTAVEIQATPDRVWSVMRDVERWPEWTRTIRSVTRLEGGPFDIGSRARIRQPKLLPAVWRVTELEEGRGFTWVARSPGVRVKARHRVEPTATGTRATLSLDFSGPLAPLVARLTRGLNERYLAIEAKGLKERSEGAATQDHASTGR